MTMTSNTLAGKVALVTGASSGLGAHFAQVLASRGASIALAARRGDKLQSVSEQIESKGGISLVCLLYTSPSPRDKRQSRMPSSA